MAGKQEACPCGSKPKLVFTCSGASDVGEIADRAARKLTRDGAGRMYCLAGIGGRVSGIMASTQAAETVLVLDGCAHDCARNTMEQAGFKGFGHLRLSDLGLAKGQTPATEERIATVAAKAAEDAGPEEGRVLRWLKRTRARLLRARRPGWARAARSR